MNKKIIRASVRDALTFDAARNLVASGVQDSRGAVFETPYRTHDGRTVDSTGAFLVGELERLDLTLHMPLAAVTWGRDIMLREDVTIADDVSSFTVSSFAAAGGLGGQGIGNGKSFIGRKANQVPSQSVDIKKEAFPLTPWGEELAYTLFELESAAKLGRPIDAQKFEALQLKWQMDNDEMVYIGDTSLGLGGLVNNALTATYGTVSNVAAGVSGSTTWVNKTADEILTDVSDALAAVWAASAWAVIPNKILIPPAQFAYISAQKVSNAGNVSILKYVKENNLLTTSQGTQLDIQPCKWLSGTTNADVATALNNGSLDRMFVYTNEKDRVRFPVTLLQRTPVQYDSIFHKSTYFAKMGAVEWVYPETGGAFDGI